EPDLVEEAQQPRRAGFERGRGTVRVPHLDRAPHELGAAGTFHSIAAQITPADADGVLRGPGAGRVVLRGDEAVPWVHGRRHRRAQIDVAESEHQVVRAVDDLPHVLDRVEAVDAADELGVAGAPRRVGAHRLHVLLASAQGLRALPRQRPTHAGARAWG